MRRWLPCFLAAFSGASLIGCGTTSHIPASHTVEAVPAKPSPPKGTAIVAVRWPLSVTEGAFGVIGPVFANKVPIGSAGLPDAYRRLPELSTYYALELYAYLRAYLGDEAVLLEPYVVAAGAEGGLQYEPILENRIPVAFVVDVVEAPAWTPCCVGGIGDYLSTNFRIAVAPKASPQTCGLLGGVRHVNDGLGTYTLEVEPLDSASCTADSVRGGPHYTFMDFYSPQPPKRREGFPKAEGLPLRANHVVTWPGTTYELSMHHLRTSVHAPFAVNAEKPDNPWSANMARAIAQAAATLDLRELTQSDWERYAAAYEPGLAPGGTDGHLSTTKRDALRVLAQAEKAWTVKQDQKIVQALLNGRFGKSFRQRRVLDAGIRKRDRSASMATAMSMYSLGMSTGLFGGAAPLNTTALVQGMSGQLSQAVQAHRDLLNYVQTELGPEAAARDQIVQVEVPGLVREINAQSRRELHEKLRELYRARFAGTGN